MDLMTWIVGIVLVACAVAVLAWMLRPVDDDVEDMMALIREWKERIRREK